jgi:hypothetical protein
MAAYPSLLGSATAKSSINCQKSFENCRKLDLSVYILKNMKALPELIIVLLLAFSVNLQAKDADNSISTKPMTSD